jgi:hypothetical protein
VAADARQDSNVSLKMNSASCLNYRIIASRDSGVAISMPMRKLQEITDYIGVICPSGAALRALVLLRAKLMLRIDRNDILMQYYQGWELFEFEVSLQHLLNKLR